MIIELEFYDPTKIAILLLFQSPYKKMTGNNLTTSNQNVKETVVPIKV